MSPPAEHASEVVDAQTVLADPAASYWLKSAIEAALARDPVDALNDALVLAAVLDDHLRTELDLRETS